MTRYLFIDESGDPGNGEGSSSDYYVELVLDISSEALHSFRAHITNWRYIRGIFHEVKRFPKKRDLSKFLSPLIELQRNGLIGCSSVYLLKNRYTGPYLKPSSPRGGNSILFRNFVHRHLLEHHFSVFPTSNETIEIVFDRFTMTKEAIGNLENYLAHNYALPTFEHVIHADSTYIEALQIAGQLANRVKDVVLGNSDPEDTETLSFIQLKDISKT